MGLLACVAFGGASGPGQADGAEKRFALLIQNDFYPDAEPLKTADDDATTLAALLKQDGFDVDLEINASRQEMRARIEAFVARVTPHSVALLYFKGIGIEASRLTHFIPVDGSIWSEKDVRRQGTSLDAVLSELDKRGAGVKIAIVDAARSNPFERRFRMYSAGLNAPHLPKDSLVIFADALNTSAEAAAGPVSPFMTQLVEAMKIKERAEDVFKRTRNDVSKISKGHEQPWVSSTGAGGFSFDPDFVVPAVAVPAEVAAPPTAQSAPSSAAPVGPPPPEAAAPPQVAASPPGPAPSAPASPPTQTTPPPQAAAPPPAAPPPQVAASSSGAAPAAPSSPPAQTTPPPQAAALPPAAPPPQVAASSSGAAPAAPSSPPAQTTPPPQAATPPPSAPPPQVAASSGTAPATPASLPAQTTPPPPQAAATPPAAPPQQVAALPNGAAPVAGGSVPTASASAEKPPSPTPDHETPATKPTAQELSSGRTFKDCSRCPDMTVLPSATFRMGSGETPFDRPVHSVTISKPFAIACTVVTRNEWNACVEAKGCTFKPEGGIDASGNRPVVGINWFDAKQYADWLSKAVGKRYHLPTEAEWEYAARGGTTTQFAWGDTTGVGHANCADCGSTGGTPEIEPVAHHPANAFGLFDMAGNVAEWLQDCWTLTYRDAPTDGSAPNVANCKMRVVRGGSFNTSSAYIKPTARFRYEADARSPSTGFRVARDIE